MTQPATTAGEKATAQASEAVDADALGPWNPGVQSSLPRGYLPLSTMHRADNVSTTLDEAEALRDLTGIALEKLVRFTPGRLVIHETLIRVMAELTVPDGDRYTDLGENFRQMTTRLLDQFIRPHMTEIAAFHGDVVARAEVFFATELAALQVPMQTASSDSRRLSLWARLVGGGQREAARSPARAASDIGLDALTAWHEKAGLAEMPFEMACYDALYRAGGALFNRRGRIGNDPSTLVALATTFVANGYGSQRVGEVVDPYFRDGAAQLGFRFLPTQDKPIVMNVKGASAAGKSTMRPLQRLLAKRLGVAWEDFALISPDIWRKFLLDYSSLGPARRYAGTLTGHELEIIDKKLDRHMAEKAEAGRMSHLLIDRFRFDSFAQGNEAVDGAKLLTRFGASIYMFFVITPPEAIVERAWYRGEKVGRYKAVDDLLAHNVEAYSGIPNLFFTWALRPDKRVHVEFIDNSVPKDFQPKTAAFGTNGRLVVLDVECLLNIDRYRAININAENPVDIYRDRHGKDIGGGFAFLKTCFRQIPLIEFAEQATGEIYARIESGRIVWWNYEVYARAVTSAVARTAFETLAMPQSEAAFGEDLAPRRLDRAGSETLGRWGERG
ncbi:MAG: hypothetical protein ABL898_17600 [Hyphomicrobiaceae bacterium]